MTVDPQAHTEAEQIRLHLLDIQQRVQGILDRIDEFRVSDRDTRRLARALSAIESRRVDRAVTEIEQLLAGKLY